MSDHEDDLEAPNARNSEAKGTPAPGAPLASSPASEIALDWAGFFVGLGIMTGDYIVAGRSMTPENWAFLKSPKAIVWIFFVAAQFAFWANIIEPLWRWRSGLRRDYGLRDTHAIRLKLAAAVVFFAIPGFFLVYVVPDSNLAHHDPKMALVNFVAVIVALIATSGIWYVRSAIEATFGNKGAAERPIESVQQKIDVVIDLRTHLQRFISLLGAMVALATLAKGALRQAILATGGSAAQFPPEFVLLQGAYFTRPLGTRLHPDVLDARRGRIQPGRVGLSRHRSRDRLERPLELAVEPQGPRGSIATQRRSGPQRHSQHFDPGAGRDQRHHCAAGGEVTAEERAGSRFVFSRVPTLAGSAVLWNPTSPSSGAGTTAHRGPVTVGLISVRGMFGPEVGRGK